METLFDKETILCLLYSGVKKFDVTAFESISTDLIKITQKMEQRNRLFSISIFIIGEIIQGMLPNNNIQMGWMELSSQIKSIPSHLNHGLPFYAAFFLPWFQQLWTMNRD